jgi:hypothetical protein
MTGDRGPAGGTDDPLLLELGEFDGDPGGLEARDVLAMPPRDVRIRRLEMLREGREVEDTRDFGLSPDDVEI